MSIFGMRHFAPCRSPEGEGGAGGGGGGLAGAAAAGAGQEPGTGGAGTSGGAWTPPEGIPTEFVGASADETLAKMLPAYTDVSKRADGLREKLSTMPKAPDSLDGYTFEPDDKLKPFFAGDLAQNPAWQHARQAAKDAGLSPEQLSKFVSGVYGPMIDGGMLAQPYNPASEIASFSKAGGFDAKSAQSALVEAEGFAKGLAGQLKGVPEAVKTDVEALLLSLTDTAAGNFLLRGLSGRLAENGIRIAGESIVAGELTDEDVKKLHSDPRIDPRNRDHADPNKRFNEDLRKRYDAATNRPKG